MKICGIDLGVSSIGLAIIEESSEGREIKKMAVRVIPEDPDFHGKFHTGNTASKCLKRTEKRGIRRNNQRFKQRRDKLYQLLKELNWFPPKELFQLNVTELYGLRAKAVTQKITLEKLGRVLILLNQRRGFLSNRKSNSEEENSTDYKKNIQRLETEREGRTIGQELYRELEQANTTQKLPLEILLRERTYFRASYIEEFDQIWKNQQEHYPSILTGNRNEDDVKGSLYNEIKNKILYYQRPLKSQKGLLSNCSFEAYRKGINKSSPYFELFRIWQKINDLEWKTSDGERGTPDIEAKRKLANELFKGNKLNEKAKLTTTEIKKILGLPDRGTYLNFTELDKSKTYYQLSEALKEAGVEDHEKYLSFDFNEKDEKGGLFELWHITYSLPTEKEIKNTLIKHFNFSEQQAKAIATSPLIAYPSDYGSLSTKAIRKLLPFMTEGLNYADACDKVGYDHSGYKTETPIVKKLKQLPKNSLRNPVVEQVLNEMVNMVNLAMEEHGPFDEIRVELARELRQSAERRKEESKRNKANKNKNSEVRRLLQEEYGLKHVNGRDVQRYKLWKETERKCLYCTNEISKVQFLHGEAEIEHILPKSRSFSNAMSNYILAHRKCNSAKGQQTAFDFMDGKGEASLNQYLQTINTLYKENGKGKISRTKFENLMCKGDAIPNDFVNRMKNDTQFIAVEAVKLLQSVCPKTYSTTGQVTAFLRKEWKLNHVLQELVKPTYRELGLTHTKIIKDIKDKVNKEKEVEVITNWSKRDDHRHHAVDALICALTDQKIIFRLNNLNKTYLLHQRDALSAAELQEFEKNFSLKEFLNKKAYEFEEPIPNLRKEVKNHLEKLFISFKKNNGKVLTPNKNKTTGKVEWTPRGRLHKETVMGKVKVIADKQAILNTSFTDWENIAHPQIKAIVLAHVEKFNLDPKQAFLAKNLKKQPLQYKNKDIKKVPVYEWIHTKRVAINKDLSTAQIEKIIDKAAKEKIKNRLQEFGEAKKAFSDLAENPIWMNKEKGIQLKSVTVKDNSKTITLRTKKDHFGNEITTNNTPLKTDYVVRGSNHHALVFKNKKGYQVKVVPFWDAVKKGLENIQQTGKPYPTIPREDDLERGVFQFSMQINDLFVIGLKHSTTPQHENELDFFDENNHKKISKALFRVQKLTTASNENIIDVTFRHHLKTTGSKRQRGY